MLLAVTVKFVLGPSSAGGKPNELVCAGGIRADIWLKVRENVNPRDLNEQIDHSLNNNFILPVRPVPDRFL